MSSTPETLVCAPEGIDSLVESLKHVSHFGQVAEDELRWMASQMTVQFYAPGEAIVREGDPADRMLVVLSGEFHGRVENGPESGHNYTIRTGQVSGLLPHSRMKIFPSTLRAMTEGCIAIMMATSFDELLRRAPQLNATFVGIIADRVRAKALNDQQLEKMAALGKLSAGVAHELNNPAAAAKRAVSSLRDAIRASREANHCLDDRNLSSEQRGFLHDLETDWAKHEPVNLDSLERADREDELNSWLDSHDVAKAWELAADLADSPCSVATLEQLSARFPQDALTDAVRRLVASFATSRLLSEIESSTSRISDLVRSIKEYSYMDQMPLQDIDVHDGLESTLTMMSHKLKSGIKIVREYDRSIPKIQAYGSELNQVWTNLIDNAIDALEGKGEIHVCSRREHGRVLVQICDNGPGIPTEIQRRIFEPFFTTKPVGKGTGLGLDTAFRTVQKHRGEIGVDSKPGDTRFKVWLPLTTPNARETK